MAPASRETIRVGLIGAGIQASRSPRLHEGEGEAQGLRYTYKLFDLDVLGLDAAALPALLRDAEQQGFAGLNITYPCKQTVLACLDELSADAAAMGAVNTRPRRHCQTGGGYAAIWAVRHGAWKEVIGTQDVIACSRLQRFGIPSEIGVHECYEDGQVVPYDHP